MGDNKNKKVSSVNIVNNEIGINSYSFRNELGSNGKWELKDFFSVCRNLKVISGIELLDHHIPGWPEGKLDKGVESVKDMARESNIEIYGLGPHLKLYQKTSEKQESEIDKFKFWIDLASRYGIPAIRTQIGGPYNRKIKTDFKKESSIICKVIDDILAYAEEKNVKIGIETHYKLSSYPPFIKAITEKYRDSPSLGVIFDWGNFFHNRQRFEMLEIAALPHNHCHNHVKFYRFNYQFEKKQQDACKIVEKFTKNGFSNHYSIEWEGYASALEGVYKSAYGLRYAFTKGKERMDPNFDYKSLLLD